MTDPASSANGPRRTPIGRAVLGVVLALIGSLTLFVLVWMSNSGSPAAEKLMFDLGLALTSLISATAQGLVFYGVWLLWRAVHRRSN